MEELWRILCPITKCIPLIENDNCLGRLSPKKPVDSRELMAYT